MKLWDKNYTVHKKVEGYTVGHDYIIDQQLVKYDCLASIAHAQMLCKINIITEEECKNIVDTLQKIISLDSKSEFFIKKEEEDCHTAIENFLIQELGDTGKKIHTARSRNDQIVTALRLYYKDQLHTVTQLVYLLIDVLEDIKKKYGIIEIPGYTHMQKAMPSSIQCWCDAFIESMNDNITVIDFIAHHIDTSPLGSGAGYGVPIKIDRKYTAKQLGFKDIQQNPLYVQNSRGKFESLILHGLSGVLFDLNKMSNDMLLFSMAEFGFVEFPQEFYTGSSIMPHKKNLDVFELIRAHYHKLLGYEFEIQSMIGNLISGYNRDVQLTKEPVIQGFMIAKESIEVMTLVLQHIIVNKKNCKKAMTTELYATQKLYDLVATGIPFRDAYKTVSTEYLKEEKE